MKARQQQPPMPPPPRPLWLMVGLAAGVLGTSLLYEGATEGDLARLLLGVPLFGLGLWLAGRPFVLASFWLRASRDQQRRQR